MFKIIVLSILVNIYGSISAENKVNYYWREYTGIIPEDAVPGGIDINGNPVYIGNGFVKTRGIIPGVIFPNQKHITVPTYGSHKVDKYISILCSPNLSAFKWLRTNDKDFYVDTINKHVVRGGLENDLVVHIGRISYQGEIVVGKIPTDLLTEAPLYFIYKDTQKKANSYEVLIYENDNNFIEVRSS